VCHDRLVINQYSEYIATATTSKCGKVCDICFPERPN
jgi:hypothetical protein